MMKLPEPPVTAWHCVYCSVVFPVSKSESEEERLVVIDGHVYCPECARRSGLYMHTDGTYSSCPKRETYIEGERIAHTRAKTAGWGV